MSSRQGTTRTSANAPNAAAAAGAPGPAADVLDVLGELMRLANQASAQGPLTAGVRPDQPNVAARTAVGRAAVREALVSAAQRMPRGVVLRSPGDPRRPDEPGRVAAVVIPALAPWLVHGPRALRLAVEALACECEAHWPVAGHCRECDAAAPCRAWNRLTGLLIREHLPSTTAGNSSTTSTSVATAAGDPALSHAPSPRKRSHP